MYVPGTLLCRPQRASSGPARIFLTAVRRSAEVQSQLHAVRAVEAVGERIGLFRALAARHTPPRAQVNTFASERRVAPTMQASSLGRCGRTPAAEMAASACASGGVHARGGGRRGGGRRGGEAFASTLVGEDDDNDDAVMHTSCTQSRLAQRANAASNQQAVTTPLEEDEAAGWELVRMHNSEYASWIVIGGRVLDVTGYLGHHPGGVKVIQKLSGQDATGAYEKARHSRAADMKLADFTIGKLGDIKRLRRAAQKAQESRERLEAAAKYL